MRTIVTTGTGLSVITPSRNERRSAGRLAQEVKMTNSIEERLKQVVVDQLDYPMARERIGRTTSLYGKGLGLSSLDVVSLIVRLEEEFGIFFDPGEIAPSLENFGALLRMIQKKHNQDGGAHGPQDGC